MANRTFGPPRVRAKHPVGAPAAGEVVGMGTPAIATPSVSPVRDIADDWRAIGLHYASDLAGVLSAVGCGGPAITTSRSADRRPLTVVFPVLLGILAVPLPFPPTPRSCSSTPSPAGSRALWLALWTADPHPAATTAWTVRDSAEAAHRPFTLNGLTVKAVQVRSPTPRRSWPP